MGKVVLNGLEFFGRHGVFPAEERLGARFVVDVEMEFDFAGLTDSLEDTVDYGAIYARVTDEVTRKRYDLIEFLAQTLAEKLMLENSRIETLTVRVHKPNAPLPGIFRDVYAEVTKQRIHLNRTLIALGGNLGDIRATLHAALEPLGKLGKVTQKSSLYTTAPWGNLEQPDFLNAVLELETSLEPEVLLKSLLEIETQFGRKRGERWGPRVLDLDLLSFEHRVLESPHLTLPHPRMLERAFVLVPLLEIEPHWTHPETGQLAQDALKTLNSSGVKKTALEW